MSSSVSRIPLYFFGTHTEIATAGCGYTAISLLTGEDPWDLRRKNKDNSSVPPRVMIPWLKKYGFVVTPVTPDYTLNLLKTGKALTHEHVVLAALKMRPEEASWGVLYGGLLWHNFEPMPTSYVTCLTIPPLSSYMLWHPSWPTAGMHPAPSKKYKGKLISSEEDLLKSCLDVICEDEREERLKDEAYDMADSHVWSPSESTKPRK